MTRLFTQDQLNEMHRLSDFGLSHKSIGKRYKCSEATIRNRLSSDSIQVARGRKRTLTHQDYREGFEAGLRQALTLVNLYGLEAVRAYCNNVVLPWRDCGQPDLLGNVEVPAFQA